MILDLRAFDEFPAEITIHAGPGELGPFDDSVIRVDGVELDLALQKSAREYFCQGRVTGQVVLECARCLAEFEIELNGESNFVVCSAEDVVQYREADNEDYVCYQGNELQVNVVEPVRQALMSSMPMKPLCSEDCLGLCPSCGVNLNEQNCDCKKETTDTRWDGLKDILPE